MNKEFSRKTFLKGGGALIVGFTLAGAASAGKAAKAAGTIRTRRTARRLSAIDSWLTIHADNTAYAEAGIVELGQGSLDRPADDRGRGARHGA